MNSISRQTFPLQQLHNRISAKERFITIMQTVLVNLDLKEQHTYSTNVVLEKCATDTK